MDTGSIGITIGAITAILGLILTSILNILRRKDELREREKKRLFDVTQSISSDSEASRSTAISYLPTFFNSKSLCHEAIDILTHHLGFERNYQLRLMCLDALLTANKEQLRDVLIKLYNINKSIWLELTNAIRETQKISGTTNDKIEQYNNRVQQLKEILEITKHGISRILIQEQFSDIDLSKAHLDGINLVGAYLEGANLSETTLSYANLKNANLKNANLNFAVLIGTYLSVIDLRQASLFKTAFSGARIGRVKIDDRSLQEAFWEGAFITDSKLKEMLDKSNINYTKTGDKMVEFWHEQELHWRSIWKSTNNERELQAYWYSEIEQLRITAFLIKSNNQGFKRTKSSDHNDGEYVIEGDYFLDPVHEYKYVWGTRTLKRGIPSPWTGIQWLIHPCSVKDTQQVY